MSTTGHENEAINVQGLKASLQKFKDEYTTDVAYLEEGESSAVIADFDPQTDTVWKKAQTLSNAEKSQVKTNLGLPQEIYSKTEVNNLITTPNQQYVTVATYASLPASGSADTIYRVSNYNGSTSQVDSTMYSEYAWNGTDYEFLCVKSQIGEVFDITAYNSNTKYADLSAALGTNGVNIPEGLRKGGMSVKFVSNSDNKYVQYRLMSDTWSTNTENWAIADDSVYVENPEFLIVYTDKNGHIIAAVKRNGDIYFGYGVPTKIKIALEGKIDKEEGKSLINKQYIQEISSSEFLDIVTDSNKRILYGVKTDGDFYFGCGVPKQIIYYVQKQINKKQFYTKVKEYPSEATKNIVTERPVISNCEGAAIVGNISELNTAISENKLIILDNDLIIPSSISDADLDINIYGNKHKILFGDEEIGLNAGSISIINGKYKYPFNKAPKQIGDIEFCDANFQKYSLSHSDFYEAESQVLDENFEPIAHSNTTYSGIIYIKIPDLLDTSTIDISNAYLNWSGWFVSLWGKITDIVEVNSEKYFKIDFVNDNIFTHHPNGEYWFTGKYPSVQVWNCYPEQKDTLYIDGTYIYYPLSAKDGKLYKTNILSGNSISIENTDIILSGNVIEDEYVYDNSYCQQGALSFNYGSIKNCTVKGGLLVNSGGNWEIKGCTFKDAAGGFIISKVDGNLYFANNKCYDCGYSRMNTGAVHFMGNAIIKENKFVDFGYSAISSYTIRTQNAQALIEKNEISQTYNYFSKDYLVMSDTGAIHIRPFIGLCIIRNNLIVRFNGRKGCHGIFCDDGVMNTYIYENIITSIPNGESINERAVIDVTPPSGEYASNKRMVACNIVDNSITLGGNPDALNRYVEAFSNIMVKSFGETKFTLYDCTYIAENNLYKGVIREDGVLCADIENK